MPHSSCMCTPDRQPGQGCAARPLDAEGCGAPDEARAVTGPSAGRLRWTCVPATSQWQSRGLLAEVVPEQVAAAAHPTGGGPAAARSKRRLCAPGVELRASGSSNSGFSGSSCTQGTPLSIPAPGAALTRPLRAVAVAAQPAILHSEGTSICLQCHTGARRCSQTHGCPPASPAPLWRPAETCVAAPGEPG